MSGNRQHAAGHDSTSDTRRFDVTVRTTGGNQSTHRDQTNQQARSFEDLPFTSSHVTEVEVQQRT